MDGGDASLFTGKKQLPKLQGWRCWGHFADPDQEVGRPIRRLGAHLGDPKQVAQKGMLLAHFAVPVKGAQMKPKSGWWRSIVLIQRGCWPKVIYWLRLDGDTAGQSCVSSNFCSFFFWAVTKKNSVKRKNYRYKNKEQGLKRIRPKQEEEKEKYNVKQW